MISSQDRGRRQSHLEVMRTATPQGEIPYSTHRKESPPASSGRLTLNLHLCPNPCSNNTGKRCLSASWPVHAKLLISPPVSLPIFGQEKKFRAERLCCGWRLGPKQEIRDISRYDVFLRDRQCRPSGMATAVFQMIAVMNLIESRSSPRESARPWCGKLPGVRDRSFRPRLFSGPHRHKDASGRRDMARKRRSEGALLGIDRRWAASLPRRKVERGERSCTLGVRTF